MFSAHVFHKITFSRALQITIPVNQEKFRAGILPGKSEKKYGGRSRFREFNLYTDPVWRPATDAADGEPTMKRGTWILAWIMLAAWTAMAVDGTTGTLVVTDPRCEFERDPLGVDTPDPRLSWALRSPMRGARQTACQVRVGLTPESLAEGGTPLWDSGQVTTEEQVMVYAGPAPAAHQVLYWTARAWDAAGVPGPWSAPASWTMGPLRTEDWAGARWITAPESVGPPPDRSGPMPIFRKSFRLDRAVRRALLYGCGLGFHEFRINGERVGEDLFGPAWTDYRKTWRYSVYDVTGQLREGENVLGLMLGNGFYRVTGGRYVKYTGSFGPPRAIVLLRVEYADGGVEQVVSDGTWRTTSGPIVFSCVYGGEDYDARREQDGWDGPGFDDGAWPAVVETDGPGGVPRGPGGSPIRVMETLASVSVTRLGPGRYLYDLGRNFSGIPRVRVRGEAGATVTLVPGELLDPSGGVTQRHSGEPVWFRYTLRGKGEETWAPRFSYYGFRYVEARGARPAGTAEEGEVALPELVAVEGLWTHAAAERVGRFESSDDILNRTHDLILSAIRSNLQHVLTDCPHREKLGWLEVSHLLADGLVYNFDVARFYAKVQQDMADSQLPDGMVPDIAPEYTVFKNGFRDSPEWGSACVINPWNAWMVYGDRRVLETAYPVMSRYVAYLAGRADGHIVSHGLGDWYDIGPNPPGESQLTSKGLTATAVYYQDLDNLARTAALLGRADDARRFREQAEAARQAFNQRFYHPADHCYDRNSQTANAMPLASGMADPSEEHGILEQLLRGIEENGWRVTAGDVGFSYLVRALTDADQGDTLYRMVTQDSGPGYVWQLRRGATTLTEAWDADPHSSHNHCMLGHMEGWFYRGLGGIRVDEAGFQRFTLRPVMPQGLDRVTVRYRSIRGEIVSAWKREGGRVSWLIQVPPNTEAMVYVPVRDSGKILESGEPLSAVEGVLDPRVEGEKTRFHIMSGVYLFSWPDPLGREPGDGGTSSGGKG